MKTQYIQMCGIQLNQGLEAFNVYIRKENRLKINDLILPKIISN